MTCNRYIYRIGVHAYNNDDLIIISCAIIAMCQEDADQHLITLIREKKVVTAEFIEGIDFVSREAEK